jgi:hypothetical protein
MHDVPDHDPEHDPGWQWSWRTLSVFLPFVGLRTAGRPGGDSLQTLRSIFVGFCTMVVLIGVVVLILGDVNPEQADRPGVSVPLVVAGCAVALVLQRLVPRPLDDSDPAALATSYRTRFFLRLAFAEACALLAFVACIAVGPAWVYAIGLVGALVGFRTAAPSRANLRADQDALGLRGCTTSLVGSLRSS